MVPRPLSPSSPSPSVCLPVPWPPSIPSLQALYELLPIGVFLGVVLLPFVGMVLYHQYKTQADEIRRRYRNSAADDFLAQLDSEANSKKAKASRKKSSSTGGGGGNSNKGQETTANSNGNAKSSKQAGSGGASSKREDKGALDDDDSDEMLLRLAKITKKVR